MKKNIQKQLLQKIKLYIETYPMRSNITTLITGTTAGFIGGGCATAYYIKNYNPLELIKLISENRQTMEDIKKRQNGKIDYQMVNILHPHSSLYYKEIGKKRFIYGKFTNKVMYLFNEPLWGEYSNNRQRFYESHGFKQDDVTNFQNISRSMVNLNSIILTRILFKNSGKKLDTYTDTFCKKNGLLQFEREVQNLINKLSNQDFMEKLMEAQKKY